MSNATIDSAIVPLYWLSDAPNSQDLCEVILNATSHEGFLFGWGTDEDDLNTSLIQLYNIDSAARGDALKRDEPSNYYHAVNACISAHLSPNLWSPETKKTDDIVAWLESELSGTQLKRAKELLENGRYPTLSVTDKKGLFLEGMADAFDFSNETDQLMILGGCIAIGLICLHPMGRVAIAHLNTQAATIGLCVSAGAVLKNSAELIFFDDSSQRPERESEEDWIDLGRSTANTLLFGLPLAVKTMINGPSDVAQELKLTPKIVHYIANRLFPNTVRPNTIRTRSMPITEPDPFAAIPDD